MHNKCNVLKSPPNPKSVEKLLPTKLVPGTEKLGTTSLVYSQLLLFDVTSTQPQTWLSLAPLDLFFFVVVDDDLFSLILI